VSPRPARWLRTLARIAGAVVLAAAPTANAAAQAVDSNGVEWRIPDLEARRYGLRQIAPGLLVVGAADERETPSASQRPIPPLSPAQATHLRQAQALRASGQLEQARAALAPLLATGSHHPAVVTEQARLLLARQDFAGAERLGRAEREAGRDSLLVAPELALALERLGRPRDAAEVALQAWLALPTEADWARETVLRLAPADLRGVREAVRRAVVARPGLEDLLQARALLDWRAGDLPAAIAGLARAERARAGEPPLLWEFARQLSATGAPRDSGAAAEALTVLAGDGRFDENWRLTAARRAWALQSARGAGDAAAPALDRALRSVPTARWPADFLVAIARGLRQGGHTDAARALLRSVAAPPAAVPQLGLEEALADLRDGPPERALPRLAELAGTGPEGAWRYAEALFFAGRSDSALALYQRLAADPRGPYSGAALERTYLIEDADPREALTAFGRIAYAEWRDDHRRALALADSLALALPRGALWAQASLLLAAQRDAAGDAPGALAALLAVADSLPGDRLAPLARQRAGDLLLTRLKDERAALAQYEECLARYPRAWNAPEVRRAAERLRRGHRPS
jgi:tetratricopeptide (TPR) repeat protein